MNDLSPKAIMDYDYGSYKGYFVENFVAEEFLCHGIDRLFSWQENKSELEFLIEVDGGVVPVEVKSGSSVKATSLKHFKEKYQPSFQSIISARPFEIQPGRTHYYPLYLLHRFLMQEK